MYIPDYNDLHEAHEREHERRLKKYPKCDYCDQHITDDHFYKVDGIFICITCLKNECRRSTEDFID